MTDTFLYNGDIVRRYDLEFIKLVDRSLTCDSCTVVLVTNGGDADAAYKIGRYLQDRYNSCTILISGMCKSAGTLVAIAASELAFAPFGELGPLDVQLEKEDNLGKLHSGLNISEAFNALEGRAKDTYHKLIVEIFRASGGIVSIQTALHAASEMISSMYGPIFGRIDPEEVGFRSRAMRIGEDYAKRLNNKWHNLKSSQSNVEHIISSAYPSHSFVIDFDEASLLFDKVRLVNDEEKKLVEHLGLEARFPYRGGQTKIVYIDKKDIPPENEEESLDDKSRDSHDSRPKPKAERPTKQARRNTSRASAS